MLRQPWTARVAGAVLVLLAAGCAAPPPDRASLGAGEGRALISRLIPAKVRDKDAWAVDIYAAFMHHRIDPSVANLCAAIAVIDQESGFVADPPVPNLPTAARREIETLRERAGIPRVAVAAAMTIKSLDGRSYDERLDAVTTERELSELFEEIISRVPLGSRLLAGLNPVRTGGPMQVSIAYAESRADTYPYPLGSTIRREVFTRRGGLHFGIAHLLDYPAPYDDLIYRYADFNAGHYASRNAAFQRAVAEASGKKLELDGDLLRYDGGRPVKEPSATEMAVRSVAKHLGINDADIRRDLEKSRGPEFERTNTWRAVFRLADRAGKPAPRAVMPRIDLKSSKFTRKLTTEWFAGRVSERQRACVRRAAH